MTSDDIWMQHALILAKHAEKHNEVPVGAVVVQNAQLIGEGWNRPIASNDPTAHAEIVAIRQAGQYLGNYRLVDASLYVTLEPCPMCAGAIIQARIKRVVFGAWDPRTGSAGSVFNLLNSDQLNHKAMVCSGVLNQDCRQLLKDFFRKRRDAQRC